MDQRAIFLKAFRGEAIGNISDESSSDELFQNQVLRPILKLQNDLFLAVFLNYLAKNKMALNNQTPEKKEATIENALQKDIKLQNIFKGMIIGLFTTDEYALYLNNFSGLNKRMMGMLMERLKSQVQLLENEKLGL
jgi:hypothetical protein